MAISPNDISNKANGLATDFKNKAMSGEHQIERMVQNVGERAGAIASDVATTTRDTLRTSREYVVDHPVKGVAIAAAAGLVVGSLLTMSLSSRRS